MCSVELFSPPSECHDFGVGSLPVLMWFILCYILSKYTEIFSLKQIIWWNIAPFQYSSLVLVPEHFVLMSWRFVSVFSALPTLAGLLRSAASRSSALTPLIFSTMQFPDCLLVSALSYCLLFFLYLPFSFGFCIICFIFYSLHSWQCDQRFKLLGKVVG